MSVRVTSQTTDDRAKQIFLPYNLHPVSTAIALVVRNGIIAPIGSAAQPVLLIRSRVHAAVLQLDAR